MRFTASTTSTTSPTNTAGRTGARVGTALLVAGLSLGLAACGGEDDTTPTAVAPADDTAEEPTTEEVTEETTTEETDEATTDDDATDDDTASDDDADDTTSDDDADDTDDATDDDDDDAPAAGGELTPPGEELSLGDPAVIQLATLADPEDDYYRYLKLEATVTEITEADPSILDDVQLATPIEDEVPYLIWADVEILETEGSHDKLDLYPEFDALHADDSGASTIWSDGQPIGECASEPFESLEVGEEARVCIVALADAGKEIGAVVWGGDDNADGGGEWEDNPYYEEPLIWRN